jgi:hypothetical protein
LTIPTFRFRAKAQNFSPVAERTARWTVLPAAIAQVTTATTATTIHDSAQATAFMMSLSHGLRWVVTATLPAGRIDLGLNEGAAEE